MPTFAENEANPLGSPDPSRPPVQLVQPPADPFGQATPSAAETIGAAFRQTNPVQGVLDAIGSSASRAPRPLPSTLRPVAR